MCLVKGCNFRRYANGFPNLQFPMITSDRSKASHCVGLVRVDSLSANELGISVSWVDDRPIISLASSTSNAEI